MIEMPEKRCIAWLCAHDAWDGSPLQIVRLDSVDREGFDKLPDDGIQGFLKIFADGTKQNVSGYDWYFWVMHPSGEPLISGNNDSPEENRRRYPGCVLKRGKHTTDEWAHLRDRLLRESYEHSEPCEECD